MLKIVTELYKENLANQIKDLKTLVKKKLTKNVPKPNLEIQNPKNVKPVTLNVAHVPDQPKMNAHLVQPDILMLIHLTQVLLVKNVTISV